VRARARAHVRMCVREHAHVHLHIYDILSAGVTLTYLSKLPLNFNICRNCVCLFVCVCVCLSVCLSVCLHISEWIYTGMNVGRCLSNFVVFTTCYSWWLWSEHVQARQWWNIFRSLLVGPEKSHFPSLFTVSKDCTSHWPVCTCRSLVQHTTSLFSNF
jgi:hypothetical protein